MQKYFTFISLLFVSCVLTAQVEAEVSFEKYLKNNSIPLVGIGVIKNGVLDKIQVYGDIEPSIKAPYNTIFNVASLTKPITAMLVLKLVSQGKWELDAPLEKYWVDPDIKNDARTQLITTRYVLSHQTGFPNWRGTDGLDFKFTPGTAYLYSGEGFEYLRKALENKFNKSLDQLAKEFIFDPLKMEDTNFVWDENTDASRVAAGFNREGEKYKIVRRKTANAADDLLTTIKDYGTFLVSVMHGEGLSESVFKELQQNQVASKNGKYFGLGFEKYVFRDGNYALSHGGSDKGVQSIVFIFPKTKQGLLIFTNVDDGYKVYEKLLHRYLKKYAQEIIHIETGRTSKKPAVISNLIKDYVPVDTALYNTILAMDTEFFDAYNNCDLEKQASIYSDNIEFFHDKGGLMTSKKDIIAGTKKYVCGKVTRTLVKGSVEVYPIKDYGAVQIGYHTYFNKQEPDAISEPVKFIIVWQQEQEQWRIAKVISLH